MNLGDFLIYLDLKSVTKKEIIQEMVDVLIAHNKIEISEKDNIVQAVLDREELGTTGFLNGIAVPHAKHKSINKMVGLVAISKEGAAFDSLDGEKVKLFFLILATPENTGEYLKTLAMASLRIKDHDFYRQAMLAQTKEELGELLVKPSLGFR